jgi:hypothetical protein
MVDPQGDVAEPIAQLASQAGEPSRPGRIVGDDLDPGWRDAFGTPVGGCRFLHSAQIIHHRGDG